MTDVEKLKSLKDSYKKLNSLRFEKYGLSQNQQDQILKMLESLEWQIKSELFKEFLCEP